MSSPLGQRETHEKPEERRRGLPDRRVAMQDRRNAERLADDFLPRRDPSKRGRRATDR